MRLKARQQFFEHRVEVRVRAQWRLHAIETPHRFAFGVEAQLLFFGERGDEAVICVEETPAGGRADPIEQFNIKRAVAFTGRCLPFHPRVHVRHALDHAPRRRLWAVDADHRGHASALRAADRIDLVGRMIPNARTDARVRKLQQHSGDAADAERDGIFEDAPRHRIRPSKRWRARRVSEVDLPTEIGFHLQHGGAFSAFAGSN